MDQRTEPFGHRPPSVATVSIATLERVRAALNSDDRAELERVDSLLADLIDTARWNGEPL